jgi:hypothetical protein
MILCGPDLSSCALGHGRAHNRRQSPDGGLPALWRAWISRGWPDTAAKRPRGMASDLDFSVGLPGFEPGTS